MTFWDHSLAQPTIGGSSAITKSIDAVKSRNSNYVRPFSQFAGMGSIFWAWHFAWLMARCCHTSVGKGARKKKVFAIFHDLLFLRLCKFCVFVKDSEQNVQLHFQTRMMAFCTCKRHESYFFLIKRGDDLQASHVYYYTIISLRYQRLPCYILHIAHVSPRSINGPGDLFAFSSLLSYFFSLDLSPQCLSSRKSDFLVCDVFKVPFGLEKSVGDEFSWRRDAFILSPCCWAESLAEPNGFASLGVF